MNEMRALAHPFHTFIWPFHLSICAKLSSNTIYFIANHLMNNWNFHSISNIERDNLKPEEKQFIKKNRQKIQRVEEEKNTQRGHKTKQNKVSKEKTFT